MPDLRTQDLRSEPAAAFATALFVMERYRANPLEIDRELYGLAPPIYKQLVCSIVKSSNEQIDFLIDCLSRMKSVDA